MTRASGYHDVHIPEDPARAVVWKAIADHLRPWVPAGSRVIEIGAGYCCWINAVAAARRVAVDAWPDIVRHVAPGVEGVVLDVSEGLQRFPAGSFDVALASNVLEHFEPDAASGLVAEIDRLLAPGGTLIVIQPNFRHAYRQYFDDYTHRSVFTDVSLVSLVRSHGFRVALVRPKFLPYSMRGRRLPIAAWMVAAYLRSPFKPGAGQMLVVARKD